MQILRLVFDWFKIPIGLVVQLRVLFFNYQSYFLIKAHVMTDG